MARATDGTPERPPSAPHWRRWRHGGTALSALLHLALLAAFTVSLPRAHLAQPETERTIPVEIVKPDPPNEPEKEKEKEPEKEKAEEKKPPEKKEEEKQKAEAPKTAEPPKAQPPAAEVPKEPRAPASPPDKPLAEPQRPAPPSAEPPRTEPPAAAMPPQPRTPPSSNKSLAEPQHPPGPRLFMPAQPPIPPLFADLMPRSPPDPRAAPPAPRAGAPGGQVVSADDDAPPPLDKKVVGVWVLDPLTLDSRDKCGVARVTASMVLTERIAEGQYRGTLQNRIVSAKCEPSSTVYHVELRINGGEVQMLFAEGFRDRGVIRGNVMMLEDAYGRSVWRKR